MVVPSPSRAWSFRRAHNDGPVRGRGGILACPGCVGAGAQAALETQLWFPRHQLDFQERRHLLPRSAQPAPIGCTWVGQAKAATSVFAHFFLPDPCLGFDKYPQTQSYGGEPPDQCQLGKKHGKVRRSERTNHWGPNGVSGFLKLSHQVFLGPEAVRGSKIPFSQQKQK